MWNRCSPNLFLIQVQNKQANQVYKLVLFRVMEAYVAALEAKLAEVSGLQVDQIKKNQMANAASEQSAINEMTSFINSISVQAQGQVGIRIGKWRLKALLGPGRRRQPRH